MEYKPCFYCTQIGEYQMDIRKIIFFTGIIILIIVWGYWISCGVYQILIGG